MATTRKTYTAEFKLNAVRMVTDQHLAVAEVARRLGITESRLHDWLKAFRAQGADAFPGHGRLAPHDEEPHRLRAEVQRDIPIVFGTKLAFDASLFVFKGFAMGRTGLSFPQWVPCSESGAQVTSLQVLRSWGRRYSKTPAFVARRVGNLVWHSQESSLGCERLSPTA